MMRTSICVVALALAGCMTAPEIKTDNVRDGTIVCTKVDSLLYGTWTIVVAKLEQRVINDGGSLRVAANCVVDVQLLPPAPKPTAAPTAPTVAK